MTAVDRAADRLAYLVLSYGLLAIAAWRGLVDGAAPFELLVLVVLGGAVGTAYRAWHRALDRDSAVVIGATVVVAFGVAAMLAILIRS